MKNAIPAFRTALLLLGSLLLFGCEVEYETSRGAHHGSSRFPSSWTNIDEEDRRKPAYAFARHGMFEEARKIVDQGEDTEAHYQQGVRYYNYWKQHSATADTGITSADVMRDITNDVLDSNESRLNEIKRKAANGDPEAQEWLRNNGIPFEVGNNAARQLNNE